MKKKKTLKKVQKWETDMKFLVENHEQLSVAIKLIIWFLYIRENSTGKKLVARSKQKLMNFIDTQEKDGKE